LPAPEAVGGRTLRQPIAPAGGVPRFWRPRGFAERRLLFLALIALPAIVYVLLVALWPVAQGVYYSFFDYNLLRPASRSFVGFDNYRAIWDDETTRRAALNTFLFTAAAVALELAGGLALALLLWRDGRFNRVATALMLVPITITPLAVGLLFRALLNADFGLIGYWARVAGISGPHGFLGDPASALGALVLIDAWEWTPLMALILLAGLKTLPQELIEAAEVDGATFLQRLRLVALPMMLPSIFLALVLRGMDAFRVFDIVFATTKGGPSDATNVLMFQAVKQGLEFFDIGAAAAIANLMIVAIAVMALVFVQLIRRADQKVQFG
jgi:multiple sugar transport system permease protein